MTPHEIYGRAGAGLSGPGAHPALRAVHQVLQGRRRLLRSVGSRNSAVVTVVILSAAVGVGCAGQPATADAPREEAPSTTDTATPAAPGTPDPESVARGFGRAFTRTAMGQAAWLAAISSWMTREQAQLYRGVVLDEIPAGTLRSLHVDHLSPGRARGLLSYDTGMLLEVRLVHVDAAGSWLVASVKPARKNP